MAFALLLNKKKKTEKDLVFFFFFVCFVVRLFCCLFVLLFVCFADWRPVNQLNVAALAPSSTDIHCVLVHQDQSIHGTDRRSAEEVRFDTACSRLANTAVLRLSGDNVTVLIISVKLPA